MEKGTITKENYINKLALNALSDAIAYHEIAKPKHIERGISICHDLLNYILFWDEESFSKRAIRKALSTWRLACSIHNLAQPSKDSPNFIDPSRGYPLKVSSAEGFLESFTCTEEILEDLHLEILNCDLS